MIQKNKYSTDLAVIIVNFNGGDYLEKCISGLKKQSQLPGKIIIIDNASTDNSLKPIEYLFPDVEIIYRENNFGFAASNNFAIPLCNDFKWLVFLNPDTVPDNKWLENLMVEASKHTHFSMFASKQLQAKQPKLLDGAGDYYHISGMMWRRGFGKPANSVSDTVCEVFSPCGGAALILRSAFIEAGGFDEDFFCYAEDVDLGFRLRLLGHRCLYIPSAVIYHEGSAITGYKSDFSIYHGHRNLVWTYVKNMPLPLFLFFLPVHIFFNIITLYWFSAMGRSKIIFTAKLDALKGLPKHFKKRQKIQARINISSIKLLKIMQRGWPKK